MAEKVEVRLKGSSVSRCHDLVMRSCQIGKRLELHGTPLLDLVCIRVGLCNIIRVGRIHDLFLR